MTLKLKEPSQNKSSGFHGGFALFLSILVIAVLGVLSAILVYSHISYKNSQKKLFIEKWDLIAGRISREASNAINDVGTIDDNFASYLYWMPAISKEIVAIRLVDSLNNPIYATGLSSETTDELIGKYIRIALDGNRQFIFPEDSGIFHTIVAVPVFVDDRIEGALLLMVNDSPEKIGIKSAVFRPVIYAVILIILLATLYVLFTARLKMKMDAANKEYRSKMRLANPGCEKASEIIDKVLNEIVTAYDLKSGSIYIKNRFSGEFELHGRCPSNGKNSRYRSSFCFDPDDPCLLAVALNKTVIYDKNLKKTISIENVKKTDGNIGLAVPLRSKSGVIGILNLMLSCKNRLDADQLLLIEQSAELLAFSVSRALELESKTTDEDNLQFILDLIETMISGDSMEAVLGAISEKIASIPGITFCRIFLLDENNKRLLLAAEVISGEGKSHKPHNIAINIEEMPLHKVALISGQPQILRSDEFEKLSLNKHSLNIPEMQNGIIQVIPMHAGDMAIGCLSIGMAGPDDESASKKGLFENMAHHLSPFLKNLLKYFEIRRSLERLRDSHNRELKQARLEAIASLANGICTNLDTMMKSFLYDMEKYHLLQDNELFSEIAGAIGGHLNECRQIKTNLEELCRKKPADKLHQLELAHFIKKAEARLLEESRGWPVKTDNIRIITHNSGSGQILGDEDELYHAVSKIVLNAIESMPNGGDVLIESRVEGRMALLEIGDQGSGMSEGEIKRIFEPFFTTKKGTSRGLGLAIALRIIALHGGQIDVQSEPGRGSRFIIKIPLIDPEQTALYNLKKKSADGKLLSL